MNRLHRQVVLVITLFALASIGAMTVPLRAMDSPAPATFSLLTDRQAVVSLDGLWRFHPGDDAHWADSGFDDSAWPLLRSDQPWSTQGYHGLSGFGWYRFTVRAPAQTMPLAVLLPSVLTDYEIYVNGNKIGGWGKMPPQGRLQFNQTLLYHLPSASAGATLQFAIRVWHHPTFAAYLGGGPRYGGGLVGDAGLVEHQFQLVQADRSSRIVDFFTVGILDAIVGFTVFGLYLFRRSEREYLWFAILLLSDALLSALLVCDFLFNFPLAWRDFAGETLGALSVIAALFFFSRILQARRTWLWRVVLVTALLDPLNVALYVFRWASAATTTSLRVLFDVPIELWIIVLLFRRSFAGNRNARLLLVPTLLLYGTKIVNGLLLSSFQFGWQRRLASANAWSIVQRPFPFQLNAIVQLIFVVALLAFLIRRFAQSRASEQQYISDLEAARTLQQVLIPESLPDIPGLKIETAYHPAQEVGGDFYQIFPLPAIAPNGPVHTLIVIGDVAGKGLPAAMTVSLLVGALRSLVEYTQSPREVLAGLNRRLLGRGASFTTCAVLRLSSSGSLIISNAGHLAPYRNGVELPTEAALPLGITADADFPEQTIQLEPGDLLTLITDGVPEASQHRELFGFERTAAISTQPAHVIANTAMSFGQADDITVLSIAFQAQA
jgi:sigma-B regulation protein RsbU (phosphoserine phosphatase)